MAVELRKSLCANCAKVNLQSLADQRPKSATYFDAPRTFWDSTAVYRSQNCPLCQLIFRCLLSDEQIDDVDFEGPGTIIGHSMPRELQFTLTSKRGTKTTRYSLQVCEHEDGEPRNVTAKSINVEFDVNEVKSWLQRCNETHSQCKQNPSSAAHLPEGFRVIEVRTGCIISPEANASYCALSYVWGGVTQVTLTEENLDQFKTPPGILVDGINLPKTISHAIEFCRQLGENYLWVDSLCILNDGKGSKHRQIMAMDQIFHNASITIIASSGVDANAELSPFKACRQFSSSIASISGFTLLSLPSPQIASENIAASKWASRGWTFQEAALSNRVIIFNGDFAYFRCHEALWVDTLTYPLSRRRDDFPGWDLPVSRLSQRTASGRRYPDAYCLGVGAYLHRDLTKEGDMLDAFRGFLNRLSVELQGHQWGLPSKAFGLGLQWFSRSRCPVRRRLGFPSWSWTGWIWSDFTRKNEESIDDVYGNRYGERITNFGEREDESYYVDRHTNQSVLTCFNFAEDGSIQCIDRQSLENARSLVRTNFKLGPLKDHFVPPDQPAQVFNSYISSHGLLHLRRSHLVFFTTSYAMLSVDREQHRFRSIDPLEFFIVRIPESGLRIGRVLLNTQWWEKHIGKFEFIVTSIRGIGYPPFLGVIIINRLPGMAPEVYERVPHAPAVVIASDWLLANPEKRNIALV